MCGRFASFATSDDLAKSLLCPKLAGFRIENRFNIAQGQWIIIVRPEKGERSPSLARWGLVPSWSKDPTAGVKPINARAEGITTKPMFRGALRHGRCLVPASGFYEWKAGGKTKVQHFIQPKGGGIFVFAGISSIWAGPDGELETCAIVTTEANSLMQPIHNRMPVILDPEAARAWLDPENKHPDALLLPYPTEAMEAWQVGNAVGNIHNDGSELIERV
jgi:putative SOS response-associated peptidase YedK